MSVNEGKDSSGKGINAEGLYTRKKGCQKEKWVLGKK